MDEPAPGRGAACPPDAGYPDAHVATLARLFHEHPAWREAARRIRAEATSAVWFRHRPGEAWHLVRGPGGARLLPGPAQDPDFVFRFTPASIRELESAGPAVADFAVRLFELMIDPDEARRVDLRIAASFGRLWRRGYVDLLLTAGPRLAAFAARHGVAGPASLARVVAALRRVEPFVWEDPRARRGAGPAEGDGTA